MELDYRGLVAIIKAASTSGVRRIKIEGTLEVEFGPVTIQDKETYGAGEDQVTFVPQEVTAKDEAEANELQNEELIYTDPLEYERIQAEG